MVRDAVISVSLFGCALFTGCGAVQQPLEDQTLSSSLSPTNASTSACSGGSVSFARSLHSLDGPGAETPTAAAKVFSATTEGAGYGDATTEWRVTDLGPAGASLSSGNLRLHAVLLNDGSFLIDSGTRCDS